VYFLPFFFSSSFSCVCLKFLLFLDRLSVVCLLHIISQKRKSISKENAIKLLRTRARIRKHAHPKPNPRETTFTRSSAPCKAGVVFKKKQRENTPTYSFLHFLRGRPFEFVYFNNGALFARVNTNTSFSLIHAKSRRPVFLSHSTEKMLFDTLARFSSSTCVRVHARLARTKPTSADGFSSSLI